MTPEQVQKRLDNGLRWLVRNYEFTTDAERVKWETARTQWMAMASEYDEMCGLPPDYTKDELMLVMAWLRGDEQSPLTYFDANSFTGGNVVVAEDTGRFKLPCKLKLADGTTILCQLRKAPHDGPLVWDVWDLLLLFRIKRVFPGCKPVGNIRVWLERHREEAAKPEETEEEKQVIVE